MKQSNDTNRARQLTKKRVKLLQAAADALGYVFPRDEDGWNTLVCKTDAQLQAIIYEEQAYHEQR